MKTAFELHNHVRQSRKELAFHYAALKEELNIPRRLRHSIQQKPWYWLGGATVAGLSIAFLKFPHRSQKSYSKNNTAIPSEQKNSSSRLSDIATTALSLLNNNAVRAGLFSTARYAFPLVQEAVSSYWERRKEKQASTLKNFSPR